MKKHYLESGTPTKFISINASYFIKGGADRFFTHLNLLLRENGHRVITFTTAPDNKKDHQVSFPPDTYFTKEYKESGGIIRKTGNLLRIFYSFTILNDLETVLKKEKPDIALIHNIYHRIPYGIVKKLKKHNVKILWWLHDYKWICPNHQLFTQGAVCRRCPDSGFLNAIRYRCQKGSLIDSVIVTLLSYFTSINNYKKYVDLFIAPSRFVADLHSKTGKTVHLEHFNHTPIPSYECTNLRTSDPHALYVGRIEQNKGIRLLIDSFAETGFRLKIVGDGNFLEEARLFCKTRKLDNIEFEGFQPPEKIPAYYRDTMFTIIPSQWHEVFGLAILESFAFGKPVVASGTGAIPEIVEHGKTGLLYDTYNKEDLKEKVVYMFNNIDEVTRMGRYAQKIVSEKYSAEKYLQDLRNLIDLL